jgi:hypothetical protein
VGKSFLFLMKKKSSMVVEKHSDNQGKAKMQQNDDVQPTPQTHVLENGRDAPTSLGVIQPKNWEVALNNRARVEGSCLNPGEL